MPAREDVAPIIKRLFTRVGVSLGRYSHTLAGARADLLDDPRMNGLIDIGAHKGEYADAIRRAGYDGPILSFEPIERHFQELESAAAMDFRWRCFKLAVGERATTTTINVSGNDGFSSSLLPISNAHTDVVSSSETVGTETVEVVTLSEALRLGDLRADGAFVKLDTQGYESQIINGAPEVFASCLAVEAELSLAPLYEGQVLMQGVIDALRDKGLVLTHIEPEFANPGSGEILQLNGLFRRVETQEKDEASA